MVSEQESETSRGQCMQRDNNKNSDASVEVIDASQTALLDKHTYTTSASIQRHSFIALYTLILYTEMFQRKKSTADIAQRGSSAAVSISGPMRIGVSAAGTAAQTDCKDKTITSAIPWVEKRRDSSSRPSYRAADGGAASLRSSSQE